jgi:hypothetical protein
METRRIPNLNTFSTLIDRFTVEIVKRSHFEFLAEMDQNRSSELASKIDVQNEIISGVRLELIEELKRVLESKHYDYISEERTFG